MMETKNIIFEINNNQYIKIEMSCQDQVFFHRFDPVIISFHDKKTTYILSQHDYLGPEVETLNYFFKEAVKNNLDISITKNIDLGCLYNEKLHTYAIKSIADKEQKDLYETIYKFLVCSEGEYSIWLYNKENLTFLQITPMYQWHFRDPEENEIFIPYDQFIKNYKSCVTIEIKKEILSEWAAQSEKIIQLIIANDD